MAIRVTTGDTQVVSTVVRPQTIVKSVTVGIPISSVNLPGTTFAGLFDVDVDSNLQDGDFAQYVLTDSAWRNVDLNSRLDSDKNELQLQITGNDSDILSLFNADSDLQAQIDAFVTGTDSDEERIDQLFIRMDSAEADIVTLSINITNNDSDILALQTRATVLESRADSNENWLDSRITNNDSDILSLQNQVDSNEVLHKANDVVLQINIDSNATDIEALRSADVSLQAQIDSNETLSKATDASLLGQIVSNDANIATLQNVDSDTDVTITSIQSQIDSNETLSKATDEAQRLVDISLQAQIDSNETLSKATDASLLGQIVSNDGDIITLQLSDSATSVTLTSLQSQIDSNEVLQKATDANLQVNIDSNATDIEALRAQDIVLQSEIDSVYNDHQIQIDSNALDIVTEVNARIIADISLQSQIDSNEVLQKAADVILQTNIDSNATDIEALRTTDTNLQTNIDSNATDIEALRAADVILQTNIDSNATDIEALRVVDISLQSQIDSNEVLQKATDVVLQTNIDSNATDIEALRAADVILQTNIDSNATDIADEVNTRISAVSTLQSQIDSNETLSKATDTSLQTQITNNDSDILALQGQPVGTDSSVVIALIDARIDSDDFRTESEINTLIDARIDSDDFRTELEINTLIDARIDSNDFVDFTSRETISGAKRFTSTVAIGDSVDGTSADLLLKSSDARFKMHGTTGGDGIFEVTLEGGNDRGVYLKTRIPAAAAGSTALIIQTDSSDTARFDTLGLNINNGLLRVGGVRLPDSTDVNTLIDARIDSNDFRTESEINILIDTRIDSDDFVDFTSRETISGAKRFTSTLSIGEDSNENTAADLLLKGSDPRFKMYGTTGNDGIFEVTMEGGNDRTTYLKTHGPTGLGTTTLIIQPDSSDVAIFNASGLNINNGLLRVGGVRLPDSADVVTLIDARIDSDDFRTEAEINTLIDARIDSDDFVDLTSTQTISGAKTFSAIIDADAGLTGYFDQAIGGNGRLTINDHRDSDFPTTEYTREFNIEFKRLSTVGASGTGTFGGILTVAPWDDSTGNKHHQLFLSDGGIAYRQGTHGSAWDSWYGAIFADNVGIATVPTVSLDINATDAVQLPKGTTAQQPTGADGMLRYNTEDSSFEGYSNAAWSTIGDGIGTTKASVHYNQTTPTTVSSENVSSVDDDATGAFTVHFTNDFSDTTYTFAYGGVWNQNSVFAAGAGQDNNDVTLAGSMEHTSSNMATGGLVDQKGNMLHYWGTLA